MVDGSWSKLVNNASGVHRAVFFLPVIVPPVHLKLFSILEKKLISYANDSQPWQSLNPNLCKVSDWCDVLGMKLNASN